MAEMNDQSGFVRPRYVVGNKRVGGVHQRDALDVDVGQAELRDDVMDVVVQTAQYGLDAGLDGATALVGIAMNLLYSFQVDRRHHADQQVDVPGDIDAGRILTPVDGRRKIGGGLAPGPGIGLDAAVLPLVEQ